MNASDDVGDNRPRSEKDATLDALLGIIFL
jgi:hypothetical protein